MTMLARMLADPRTALRMGSAIVRHATEADLPAVLVLGKAFFDAAGWPNYAEWHEPSTAEFLRALINGPFEGGLIVAEVDGEIVGMTGFICFPFYFNASAKAAQELFWYAREEHRVGVGAAMHDELERAAREHGAAVCIMSAVSGLRDEALARLYRMRGYGPGESTFMKRL